MIARIIQGILYTGFLTFGSISDIRTHTVPDWVWMGVAGTALIGMKLSSFPSMLLGAAAVLLIEVPLAVAMKDRAIGGADIKISAAGAFLYILFRAARRRLRFVRSRPPYLRALP